MVSLRFPSSEGLGVGHNRPPPARVSPLLLVWHLTHPLPLQGGVLVDLWVLEVVCMVSLRFPSLEGLGVGHLSCVEQAEPTPCPSPEGCFGQPRKLSVFF
ncbi:MAG: hypothetical protein VKJ64_21595 [Leptolyngbyaceae bacterium]|nr:hypothetical protein [Leptolyngbyaceae bacterium]